MGAPTGNSVTRRGFFSTKVDRRTVQRSAALQYPLQITWRNVAKSDALDVDIRTKAEKLGEFFDKISGCRVTVERASSRHRRGNRYRIHIDIRVPDDEIAVTHDSGGDHSHEDIYVCVRDAFDAARRQLQDYARIRRGQVKHHETRTPDPAASGGA